MEFSIRKSARSCEHCAAEFVHGQSIHSAVSFSDQDALARADYCDRCWTATISRAAYSAWTTHFFDPKVADQQPPEVFSPLRRLFYEACASDDRLEQAKAFLAAQLLRRQKVFRQIKESGELDGETRTTLYTDRIGNQFIEVRDPNFTYAELDAARATLLRCLRELEEGVSSDPEPVRQHSDDSGPVTESSPVMDVPESVAADAAPPADPPEDTAPLSEVG
jgi:hypothetical protein